MPAIAPDDFSGDSNVPQQNLSRMTTTPPPPRYEFGPFRLDVARRLLQRDGSAVSLKPKVLDLLILLVANADRVLSKEELLTSLWPGQFIEESNLTQSIYELRRSLGDFAGAIETVPRRGYRFTDEVRKVTDPAAETPAPVRSVAVLPFRSLAAAEADAYLELGIAETLISALIEQGGLEVRPASAISRYGSVDPLEAARALGVDAVVEGSLQREHERLRVNARLVRTTDGATLWAQRFDERVTDIFALQDAIADCVLAALSGRRTVRNRGNDRHDDVAVHHLFLKCRYYWHKWTPQAWQRSIEYGLQAIALDPSHAESHAWTAASYCASGVVGSIPRHEAFREARRLVQRALELDATLSVAHEVVGAIKLFYDWEWDAAEASLRRALELHPANAGARDLLGLLFVVLQRNDEAVAAIRRALHDDPLSLLMNTDGGWIFYFTRRYEEALEQLQRTLELDPFFGHARVCRGFVLIQLGRHEEAIAEMVAGAEYSGGDPRRSPEVAYARAVAGDESGAREILKAMGAGNGPENDPYLHALVHAGLGDHAEAMFFIERAIEERSREVVYMRANPAFDALRQSEDCERLLRPLGV